MTLLRTRYSGPSRGHDTWGHAERAAVRHRKPAKDKHEMNYLKKQNVFGLCFKHEHSGPDVVTAALGLAFGVRTQRGLGVFRHKH